MDHADEMERQRITCTGDDFVIERWESRHGYVHVDGVRVLGGNGSRGVPVKTVIELNCLSCANRHGDDGHYTVPAVLWGRYEHALDRPMYWFSAALDDCAITDFPPVEILKAADCYEYQACEHDAWYESATCALIERVRALCTRGLPLDALRNGTAYEQATWGIKPRHPRR